MADSEGNPPDAPEPRNVPPSEAKPLAPVPRSNPPNINAGKEKAPAAGGPPGFSDFLEWMRSQVAGEAGTTDQRTPLPKERKKFQRQDAETRSDKTEFPPATAATSPAPTASPAPETPAAPVEKPAPVLAPAASVAPAVSPAPAVEAVRPTQDLPTATVEPSQHRVRRGQQAATKRNIWLNVLMQAGALALLVVSFLFGRASVSKVAAPPSAAPAAPEVTTRDGKTTTNLLSSANAALIDQAMAAAQDSKFKEATEMLEKVRASGERVRGLSLQLALLASFANQNTRALPLLNEAIAEGDDLGEAYNLRATLGARQSVFRGGGMSDYETAAKLAPFDARVFYYWGGALRLAGKPQEASVHLQQAIDRLRDPSAEGIYRLSLRLTQIETGQDKVFADELARQLALPHPNMDWLFTAAALALRDAKYDAAASYLDRAEACGDPDGFSLRLRDFYVSQFSTRKELARFFAKPAKKPATPSPDAKPTPAPAASTAPLTGLDVPALPPPATPGATVAQ